MNAPVRKPVIPVEATQELQAADVLEVLGTRPAARMGAAARRPLGSQSSIAPVGLDLASGDDGGDEDEYRGTSGHTIPPPARKRFKGLVIGVVSGCALILVAAGVARVVHASDEPTASASSSQAAPQQASTPTQPGAPQQPAATAVAHPSLSPAPVAAAAPPFSDSAASTGTVRLDKPAKAGRVWIDGKKITSSSAVVSCGTHRVKIGHGRTHSIDVPCGGEIGISH